MAGAAKILQEAYRRGAASAARPRPRAVSELIAVAVSVLTPAATPQTRIRPKKEPFGERAVWQRPSYMPGTRLASGGRRRGLSEGLRPRSTHGDRTREPTTQERDR